MTTVGLNKMKDKHKALLTNGFGDTMKKKRLGLVNPFWSSKLIHGRMVFMVGDLRMRCNLKDRGWWIGWAYSLSYHPLVLTTRCFGFESQSAREHSLEYPFRWTWQEKEIPLISFALWIIWKDHYPKEIKFFLWELSHRAVKEH